MHLFPRYERHVELIGLGEKGQLKLFNSNILIVGAGGLGCPALLYLAASGVGRITVIDDDVVSLSNLQRQVLYDHDGLEKPKVDYATQKLSKLNSDIKVTPVCDRITIENVERFITAHDLIMDCSDNFKTRYILNDSCIKAGKTLISGASIYYEGQLNVFKGSDLQFPCYRCLFPVEPTENQAPTCSESAVLGPVPGVIGTLMAVEAIKELVNIGTSLAGSLVTYSALTGTFDKVVISKNKNCRACNVAYG